MHVSSAQISFVYANNCDIKKYAVVKEVTVSVIGN